MTTYSGALTDPSKGPVWILDLTTLGKRWRSRKQYQLASSDAPPYLLVEGALDAKADVRSGQLDFDEIEIQLVDEDGSISAALSANDSALRGTPATLKYGFLEVAESDFKSVQLFVDEWGRTGKGSFYMKLRSALSFLDSPLFEDFDGNSFPLLSTLDQSDAFLTVAADLGGAKWRSSGYVLLSLTTYEVELIEYSALKVLAQNQTRVTIANRRKFGVGATGKTWPAQSTQVAQCWAYQSDPIRLFLRLATTTEAGGNGPEDAADGDGVGAKVPWTIIDRATLLAYAQRYFPTAAGAPRKGIFLDTRDVRSFLDWFSEELLFFGFRLSIAGDGKLSLAQTISIQSAPVLAGGKFLTDELKWTRGYRNSENGARWAYDYNPAANGPMSKAEAEHGTAQGRYGKSKLRVITSKGARGIVGAGFGFPDLGWDVYAQDRCEDYVTELANPSEPVLAEAFVELQDTAIGQLVQVTHPGVYNLATGKIGVTNGLAYVASLRPLPDKGMVELGLRFRRLIGRPQFVAEDFSTDVYLVDFNTSGGETVSGWDKVTASTTYPTAGGVGGAGSFGWNSAAAGDVDRDSQVSPSEIYDSYVYALNNAEKTFRMDVTNGAYRLRLAVGDPTTAWSELRVVVNGTEIILAGATAAGEWLEKDLFLAVTGGKVEITIGGKGSSSTRTPLAWARVQKLTTPGDNFSDASEAQKQFWYAAPNAGNMSDGSPAYDVGI